MMEQLGILLCIVANAAVLRKMIRMKNDQGVIMGVLILGMCVACLVNSLV